MVGKRVTTNAWSCGSRRRIGARVALAALVLTGNLLALTTLEVAVALEQIQVVLVVLAAVVLGQTQPQKQATTEQQILAAVVAVEVLLVTELCHLTRLAQVALVL